MKITITIITDNDAFGGLASYGFSALDYELKRVMASARGSAVMAFRRSRSLDSEAVLFDSNGASCGVCRCAFNDDEKQNEREFNARHGI